MTERFADAAGAVIAVNVVGRTDPSLPDRVREYVAQGDGDAVFAAIGRAHPGGWSSSWSDREQLLRRALYERLDDVDPAAGVRWARVVAAFPFWAYSLTPIAGADWAEALVADLGKCYAHSAADGRTREAVPVRYATLDAIVCAGGGRPGELLTACFMRDPTRRYGSLFHGTRSTIRALSDYPAAVAAYAGALVPPATAATRDTREVVLHLLGPLDDVTLGLFADTLAEYLVATTAAVSLGAEQLATRCPRAPLALALRNRATNGSPTQQIRALRALWKMSTTEADRVWAVEFVAGATSAAAKALAREWADLPVDAATPTIGGAAAVPEPVDWRVEITPDLRTALDELQRDINRELDRAAAEFRKSSAPAVRRQAEHISMIDDGLMRALYDALTAGKPPRTVWTPFRMHRGHDALIRFAGRTGVDLTSLFTVLQFFSALRSEWGDRGMSSTAIQAVNELHERSCTPTLLAVAGQFDAMGAPGTDLVFDAYRSKWPGLARDWTADDVAPFVAAHLDRFAAALAEPESYAVDTSSVYRALGTLPGLPTGIADSIYQVALGTSSKYRLAAQQVLDRDAIDSGRLHTALRDGSADVRMVSAQWLGRIGGAADIRVLDEAFMAERTDRVRQAQLDALAALGRSPDHYLNRETLSAEVTKARRKGPARELEWLDWTSLPPVRWADDSEFVDIDTLQWLLSAAVKLKSPEPSVALRYYCALLDPADAERLGDHLLDTWLSVGSIKSKGVLAICAVCCGDAAAPWAEDYIRKHYGHVAAHCKALLGMLSWVDRPNAVQSLLAISTRFRTKSIQDEAAKQVHALAERKGWTADELADRTVPDGGFGADGRLALSYGQRVFSARICADLKVVLFAPDGSMIKSLPVPRRDDDADAAADAKRQLAVARKAIKSTITHQRDRLYESMCSQRSWSATDWDTYIRHHPVVGQLAQRLIWTTIPTDDNPSISFRPLDDGSLTDSDDEELTLLPGARIRLAYPGCLDAATTEAWRTHLEDYEVVPLFDQLAAPRTIDTARTSSVSFDDYEGHLLDAFSLRSAATKRGYVRGATGDGGVITSYEKSYPATDLVAVIGFSGSQLPEENHTVALTSLRFTRGTGAVARLGDVPMVLLSETIRDVAEIASTGTGFDDGWRSKVEFG